MTPPAEALAHAAGAVSRISPTAPDMRWVPQERWHVTLAFLGEVNPDRIPHLSEALHDVSREHEPLAELRLEGSGTFRGALWIGLAPTERHSPADRLARAVQRAMRGAGVPVERRPWRAHLTVARWKPTRDRDLAAREVAAQLAEYVGPELDVAEFHLVHSVTGPKPTYTDLATFTLEPSPDM